MIDIIFQFVTIIVLIVITHEFGHWLMITHHTKQRPIIGFEMSRLSPYIQNKSKRKLTKDQRRDIILGGVVFGFIALGGFMGSMIWHHGIESVYIGVIAISFGYIGGCIHDFRMLKELYEN